MKKINKGAIITAAVIALILAVGYGVKLNKQNIEANWPDIIVGRATSTDMGAFQIDPSFRLNKNLILTIRAMASNTDYVYVGNSAGTAVSTSSSNFILLPGESMGFFVEGSSDLWFSTVENNEGIEYFTESEANYNY